MSSSFRIVFAALAASFPAGLVAQELALPMRDGSVRFLVIGDGGTGGKEQYQVADQMERFRQKFPFTFAIMLGDNVYGSERPQDMERKFERPYKALLDAGVKFHAALGNHDDPNQRFFKPFNLGGERYRTFKEGNVRFFVLDSNYMDPDQLKWLEKELEASGSDWKIPYFHHPLYTTAGRGPEIELRQVLEPLFVERGVDVVFAGHEHIYERLKPQKGITHFTAGGSAKLRRGDTEEGALLEVGFDKDRSFMLVEVAGDSLFFQAISRTGETVDKGVVTRREADERVAVDSQPEATKRSAGGTVRRAKSVKDSAK